MNKIYRFFKLFNRSNVRVPELIDENRADIHVGTFIHKARPIKLWIVTSALAMLGVGLGAYFSLVSYHLAPSHIRTPAPHNAPQTSQIVGVKQPNSNIVTKVNQQQTSSAQQIKPTNISTPTGIVSSPVSSGSKQSTSVSHWLMTSELLGHLISTDPGVASHFFNSSNAFAKSTPVSGLAATPIASYTSYAQFSQDLSDGSFPSGVKWVMFGIESTTNTPLIEQQQPNVYLPKFAELAHQHGLKVIEVPGMDLVYVKGADCHYQYPETTAQAYINCHIPEDSSQANIYLIEAQGDQSNINNYKLILRTRLLAVSYWILATASSSAIKNQ